MSDINICLNSMEDVLSFVRCAVKYPCNMDLVYGKSMVDAKSIVGVLGMAMGKNVRLCIYDDKADAVIQAMQPFAVK